MMMTVQDLQEQCSLQIKARLLSRKVWNLVMLLPTNPEISESLSTIVDQVSTNDFLFLAARLVAYWPAPIHVVAPPAYTVLT